MKSKKPSGALVLNNSLLGAPLGIYSMHMPESYRHLYSLGQALQGEEASSYATIDNDANKTQLLSNYAMILDHAYTTYERNAVVAGIKRLSDPEHEAAVANQIAGLATNKGLAQQFLESIGVATPDGHLTKNFGG
jgi:hypothetical protein